MAGSEGGSEGEEKSVRLVRYLAEVITESCPLRNSLAINPLSTFLHPKHSSPPNQ